MQKTDVARRLTVGAEMQAGGGADVRVWAPACRTVDLVIPGSEADARVLPMAREPDGHFRGLDPEARAGGRYWFRLDGERLRPDPVSRWQPDGPHEPSAYVDPRAFAWTDAGWPGLSKDGQVVYELHIGTFTPEGTWRAAAAQLPELARLGVTVIEVMPIADFPGRFGWGYDGVDLYAPAHMYGAPDDLRAFVDRAHASGLGVMLDVVYNHLGPDGNYLSEFSAEYFTDKYTNDWGRAINFEGPPQARAHFVQNAGYWIDEYHFDGLRLDATQDVKDASVPHVIVSIVTAARAAAGSRAILIVAENEPQDTRIVRPAEQCGFGADALWNDDAHHAAAVALTGRREAYYTDYTGSAQELVAAARWGYIYQGQWYSWQEQRRGTPALDLLPHAFVTYLENHDQVANSAFGRRLHQVSAPALHRAMTAWLLLGPATPMLFQGQEFASSRPFLFFADHRGDLAGAVRKGRVEFLSQFRSLEDDRVVRVLDDPGDERTFVACKLDFAERERHREAYAMHVDLLALRRRDPVLARAGRTRPEGAVLNDRAFVLRYLDADHGDRLLVVNLGPDLDFSPAHEPLTAPPLGHDWRLSWSSEAPAYGGQGTPSRAADAAWTIPGACALFFEPASRQEP
jgi:maltooligosyltrehalose trehalohydrolase